MHKMIDTAVVMLIPSCVGSSQIVLAHRQKTWKDGPSKTKADSDAFFSIYCGGAKRDVPDKVPLEVDVRYCHFLRYSTNRVVFW